MRMSPSLTGPPSRDLPAPCRVKEQYRISRDPVCFRLCFLGPAGEVRTDRQFQGFFDITRFERFLEIADGTVRHCGRALKITGGGGEKYDGRQASALPEYGLHGDAVYAGHIDIRNYATALRRRIRRQKATGGREDAHTGTQRAHETCNRQPNRFIVVDNGYQNVSQEQPRSEGQHRKDLSKPFQARLSTSSIYSKEVSIGSILGYSGY
jgi:hypothetical protein